MLLYLYFVLAGRLCHSFTDVPDKRTVLQSTMAVLPCPQEDGDVTWSRFINGEKVILVIIEDGVEKNKADRFGSLADNSLFITDVTPSDTAMYLCNQRRIYLEVTTDPHKVPEAGNGPTDPGLSLRPGQGGVSAADENQQPSDLWKVPVGVLVGAALVLLAVFTMKVCSKKSLDRKTNVDKTVPEVIYEEIEGCEVQPGSESDVESPYYWTPVTDAPVTSTPANNNLYSTVNRLKTGGGRREECVYYLAQNPPQAAGDSE